MDCLKGSGEQQKRPMRQAEQGVIVSAATKEAAREDTNWQTVPGHRLTVAPWEVMMNTGG
jgi:hypothetical protein